MHLIYNDVMTMLENNGIVQKHPEKIIQILECLMAEVKETNKPEFEHMLIKLHKIVYEGKFSEYLAKYATKHMKNKDPKHSSGEYWSERDVLEIAKKYVITEYNSDPWGVYYVLNMVRSDFYNSELPEDEEKYYAVIAKDFLSDIDSVDNKPFCYWMHIAKKY